jgi:HEAT repeat protein
MTDHSFHDDNPQDVPDYKHLSLDEILDVLRAGESGTLSAAAYYGLSGLNALDMQRFKPVWDSLTPQYRHKLMARLTDISETNFEMDYRSIGLLGLVDISAEVREAAINLLWEDESLELMMQLIDIALWDEAATVRAAATSALGRFILMGELGDMPEVETVPAQEAVINILTNNDEVVEVRRRALESIANCGHEIVDSAIIEAYNSPEPLMQVSAVFAMGRTCDTRWNDIVLREIDSDDPEMRYEAARASGELEIVEAVPHLTRLAQEADREVQEVAIWSLGEIGGQRALKVLSRLAEAAEDSENFDLLESIEDAIATASLAGGTLDFDLDE